jgi:ABC-2 type transport system permease protein
MRVAPPDVPRHIPSARVGAGGRAAIVALVIRDLAGRPQLLRMPLLLDLAFGVVNLVVFLFISRVLSIRADGFEHSASYFDFVAVGITFMLVLQAASTQLTARIARERTSGTLEMLAAQPIPMWAFAVGLAAYPFVFALLRAVVYLAILGVLLGLHVGHASWVGVALVLGVGVSAMMGIGIALMAFSIAVGHGDAVARVLVVALAFISGTYFPVTVFPGFLQQASAALPTRMAMDGLRGALAGGAWGGAALALLAASATLLPLSIWLFSRALSAAGRRGTLTRG